MARGFIWFIVGQFAFGLVIGVMAGLSFSPLVGSIISLLFAFIGGSLLVLIKGRSEDEMAIIGMSVTFLSLAIIIGAITGIYLRVGPPPEFNAPEPSARMIDKSLEINQIVRYGSKPEYSEVLCVLIQSSPDTEQPVKTDDIVKLMEEEVDSKIIRAMLDADFDCRDGEIKSAPAAEAANRKTGETSGFGLFTEEARKTIFGSRGPTVNQVTTE